MKRKPKPSTAQLITALNRRITRMHEANVEQNRRIALDLGALSINVNQLLELRRHGDVQMDRIIRILWKQQAELEMRRGVSEANAFMASPARSNGEPLPKSVIRPDGSGYWRTAAPRAPGKV